MDADGRCRQERDDDDHAVAIAGAGPTGLMLLASCR
jgi:threonine dehydrogenase-like Zn-dependent dehydrogenase